MAVLPSPLLPLREEWESAPPARDAAVRGLRAFRVVHGAAVDVHGAFRVVHGAVWTFTEPSATSMKASGGGGTARAAGGTPP